jgi:esterase/lipase
MFSNVSDTLAQPASPYPALDSALAFGDYIEQCQALIASRRTDLDTHRQMILSANVPFEYRPTNIPRYGALLVHGLLDSPFTMQDIGRYLQSQGILSRAILLPGHGTRPEDLLSVSYRDWMQAVRYGVESFRNQVEHLFIVGYSTGATLAIEHALTRNQIAGIILLSPAIKIKAPVSMLVKWHKFVNRLIRRRELWLFREKEHDYAKYQSIPFHAIQEVAKLTRLVRSQEKIQQLSMPMFTVATLEDETVSTSQAIEFFTHHTHPDSRLLLYAASKPRYTDPRIIMQNGQLPALRIDHYAHTAIPFAPDNPHYGIGGDAYPAHTAETIYGAYNRVQQCCYNLLYRLGLSQTQYQELSYNPTFNAMAKDIANFILAPKKQMP